MNSTLIPSSKGFLAVELGDSETEAWKSQGLTVKRLLAVELGDSEIEHGLTFVALSRATSIDNVF
jgi:hypothetical protein